MMIKYIALLCAISCLCFFIGKNIGYKSGYKVGYDAGYTDGYKERNKLVEKEIADAVAAHSKVETKIVYQKVPYTGNDVEIVTEKPKVTISVNGEKQQIKQHSETATLSTKTEASISIKVPERRWAVGIGSDGKNPMFMLKAPVKNAVGVWAAGGKGKFMGGVSFSF